MATKAQRTTMGKTMDLLVAEREQVGYLQQRPMSTKNITTLAELRAALVKGIRIDCSESATLCTHIGGLKNPNGHPYDGWGNTQEMYDALPHYLNPRVALVGALVFFGIPGRLSSQHVAVVREPGPDPLLFSHGGNGAFAAHLIPLSVEARYHVGHPVFLSIAKL